jgi:tetratricopeptide (TPR) repeat protein
VLAGGVLAAFAAGAGGAAVKVSEREEVIPTYLAGEPEPNPMFYFGRNSQGAEGRVYPYPLYDGLTNVKSNKVYRLVYLENEYVRLGILPAIGGRLFEAVDKSNGYNFVYRQHVIKPALIGLIGAWISGGIEWNIPHHHRATTFLPVQYRIEQGADGSKTVWVGELELRQRMCWAVGYTLRPGRSWLECSVRIVNRTPLANTMLCFANVAVHVNEHYQVIYPPHTQFVTYHAKNQFTTWPVATTRYSGADFTRGVEVSWYSNHWAANSMFAWNYEDDFFAGYDHGQEAGVISVADHHVVPGKKFWTWGNGPRGRMWDKILTDDDGPYIELMVGAYSDNQPDYSWLQPGETKSFQLYWYPFRDIKGVKHANLEGAVNLEVGTNGTATLGFCTTAAHRAATVSLQAGGRVLLKEDIAISPGQPYVKQVPVPAGVEEHDLCASLAANGRVLVAYSPVRLAPATMPKPYSPPPPPRDLNTVEELYLAGQRLEQFHNPSLKPEPYWEEALRRDPGDARVNTVFGIRKLRQARFTEAEAHFRKALERLTANYTSPRDGEPFYYLGAALKAQDRLSEACDAFYKATWSEAWRAPACYSLAELATMRGDLPAALDLVNRALEANALDLRALSLKAALLRHTGQTKRALAILDYAARQTDPLDVGLLAERWLAQGGKAAAELAETLRRHPATGLEAAAGYADAGLWQDGAALLRFMVQTAKDQTRLSPLVYYYLGQFAERLGDAPQAAEDRRLAMTLPPDYVFPFQWEAIAVLRRASALNPSDARAPYYLGNLLYDWQPEEAVKLWEKSAALDPSFPIVHRNLAVAYTHQKPTNDTARAIAQLEQAVSGPVKYARHFAELDELYAAAGTPPEKRLALLQQNHAVVAQHDDALSREIGLQVFAGQCDEALRLMTGRKFAVWEGGTLEVAEHWVNAHLLRGRKALAAGQFAAALADFQAARTIPDNLPSDQEGAARNAELAYWLGAAWEGTGDLAKARQFWQEASEGPPAGARRRGEGRFSERQAQVYFQALARRKLGQGAEAETALRSLLEAADQALEQGDSSEGSRRRQSPGARTALAHYLRGLGQLGLGEKQKASQQFAQALEAAPDLLGAKVELGLMQ